MKLRSAIGILFIAAGLCLASYTANGAEKYDDSSPFVCVPTAVAECVREGECRPGTAESENLTDFFKIDLREKTIGSKDKKRLSLIKGIDRTANDITLYGTDSDRFWVLKIQKKTGRMSASVIGDGQIFAIFCTCPLP